MSSPIGLAAVFAVGALFGTLVVTARSGQDEKSKAKDAEQAKTKAADPAAEATAVRAPKGDRPELQLTDHDKSPAFDWTKPAPLSPALKGQPNEGRILGFEFSRDPLGAPKPFTTFDEVMKKESEAKPKVMADQKKLLETRCDLTPKPDPAAKMTRCKPILVGPTARLAEGVTFDALAAADPAEIKKKNQFPYPSLPHPLHTNGGQVFPRMQINMFPRLDRFDVDFDLPEAFLPEFPPAIFLQNRPELGDVSRGQVVSLANFRGLFKDILTPVHLEGLRMLLTPWPRRSSTRRTTGSRPFRRWGWPASTATSTATRPGSST